MRFFVITLVIKIVYMDGFSIHQHLGTKTRYDMRGRLGYLTLEKSKDAVGCQPIYIYGLVRHGTRYPTKKRMQEINSNQLFIKELLGEDTSLIQQDQIMAGELHHIGETEMYQLGARLAARFPTIFSHPYSPKTHKIQSSQKSRAVSSAVAFNMGVWQNRSFSHDASFPQPVALTMDPKNNDPLLRFFDLCPEYWKVKKETEKTSMSWMKRYYKQILDDIRVLSNYSGEHQIDEEKVISLWNQCVNQASTSDQQVPVCQLFKKKHAKILNWLDDLLLFQTKGPGQLINVGIARPLVQDLIQVLEDFEAEKISVEKSRLYFGHAETIIPFEALIGIVGQDPNGDFQGNFIAPYGANFLLIIYDCGQKEGLRVQLYQNEERIGCNGGSGGSCLLKDYIQQLYHKLQQYEQFDKLCGIEENGECKVAK